MGYTAQSNSVFISSEHTPSRAGGVSGMAAGAHRAEVAPKLLRLCTSAAHMPIRRASICTSKLHLCLYRTVTGNFICT